MATRLSDVLHHLGYAALTRDADGLSDAELLERFLARRDEVSFAVLVRRHGPMVLGVCRLALDCYVLTALASFPHLWPP